MIYVTKGGDCVRKVSTTLLFIQISYQEIEVLSHLRPCRMSAVTVPDLLKSYLAFNCPHSFIRGRENNRQVSTSHKFTWFLHGSIPSGSLIQVAGRGMSMRLSALLITRHFAVYVAEYESPRNKDLYNIHRGELPVSYVLRSRNRTFRL